jgi:AAA15 family ATPase/GTPase
MRFSVRGYKCLINEVEVDLGRINIFWGPMGSGKSAILESFTIFHDIVSGREVITEDGKLRETSLGHLQNLELRKLLISRGREKELEMTMSNYQYELSISSIVYPAASPLFNITLRGLQESLQEKVSASIEGLKPSIVESIFDGIKSYIDHPKSYQEILSNLPGDESREFFKKVAEYMDKARPLRSFIEELVKEEKIVYISSHRPSPRELKEFETKSTESYASREWLSTGEHISSVVTDLIQRRVERKGEIERLEKYLMELGVISSIPAIQTIKEEGKFSIEVDKRDLVTLSSGERSSILLLLGAIQTPEKGFLIIEEPEIGLFIENFTTLFRQIIEILTEKNAYMIMSTHNYTPLHILRILILSNKVKREDINLYYITKRDRREVRVMKIMLDEKGRPIFSPDVRDLLREYHIEYLDKFCKT